MRKKDRRSVNASDLFRLAQSLLCAVGAGLIAAVPRLAFVVRLLVAATAQLMMPLPPLSFDARLCSDDRAGLGRRHSLRAVKPRREKACRWLTRRAIHCVS